MSDKLVQVQDLVNKFYSKPFYLSYSGLNKLLFSPSLFYRHYVLQEREDKVESYLIDGKVIHCLLLDDGSFDEQFILMPATLPTGNTRTVVDRVYAQHHAPALAKGIERAGILDIYKQEIVDILKEIKLHQSLKTDDQRVNKIINDETKSYWEFLKIRGDKTLIDSETLARCNEAVTALRENSKVCTLLGLLVNEMQNVNIYNETLLFVETNKAFGLKGVVDNVVVDHDGKRIFVNDLKTTGKTISDFKETIEFYNYWAQAAIYERLIRYRFNDILTPDWKIVFSFIVVDKYNQVYDFQVSSETMLQWQLKLETKLNEAEWHYNNRNYTLPYQFANGVVIL
jgi:hypothetical protein